MKTIDLTKIENRTYTRRRYGKQFYAYGDATYEGKVYDMGDPFPSINFPRYAAVRSVLINLSQVEKITVSERQFRKSYKGIKEGAEMYAKDAEYLESLGVEFI